ncbi:MAG: T9SS type A sorting domain-containing protein [Chitinophagales bacterium]|nr:T9SS type A sorting domain-containing protein [Chitinophagales bacterium]
MNRLTFAVLAIMLSSTLCAQEVIGIAGDHFMSNEVQISWTIGEPVVTTQGSNDYIVTQGFHQTNMKITAIEDFDKDVIVKVFPNPVASYFNVEFEQISNEMLLTVFDINGRVVEAISTTNDVKYSFDVSYLPSGTYTLVISDIGQKTIKTFKIIKTS